MRPLRQHTPQPCDDQRPRRIRFPKPHFRLGGVHIHVDPFGIGNQVQHRRRMPVAGQDIEIRHPQRRQQQLVLHRAAIHKDMLLH